MERKQLWKQGMAVLMTGAMIAGSFGPALPSVAAGTSDVKSIVALKTNGRVNPLGIDSEVPVFGWQMQSDAIGAKQTAYRIVVTDLGGNVMWDSGKVKDSASTNIAYEGKALQAKTEYQWKVTVTDETGKEYQSETNTFETSLMDTTYASWDEAEWIGSEDLNFDSASAAYFDMDMTVQIPEGSSKAAVILGAGDFRLRNSAMNIWGSQTENSYYKYEVDIADPAKPVLNIYVAGMPANGQTEENDENVPDFTVEIPAEVFKKAGVHGEIVMKLATLSNINKVSCILNGVTVDNARQLNPLGSSHDYNSFPNLNSIGFAVPAGETATYKDIQINYPGDNVEGVFFNAEKGATYDIFKGLNGVTVGADHVITVNGGADGVLAYADPSHGSSPMVRTEFKAENKEIASARLYVTAQGIYEVFLNGEQVGDGWFNPGSAEYASTMPYQVYDVTDMLKAGDNAIGAQMGSGWWSGYQTYTASNYNYYGAKQALLAKMDITYADGTTQTVVTDKDTWRVSTEGPVEYDSFYQGERYNGQTAVAYEGWSTAAYNDAGWEEPAVLEPRFNDFDFVTRYDDQAGIVKELDAVEALGEAQPGTGSYIYDMGENVIGIPKITIPAEYVDEGDEVTIRYAEILYPDLPEYAKAGLVGSMMVENLRAALCTDFYTATAGDQVFEPHFTFHGYRYIEITGLKKALPKENIKTEVLSSVEMTASYDSSNDLVNRLFKNVQNSQTSNFLSLPTDCPQRNERMGWTGDAQVFSLAASYNTDVYNFYRNWLVTLRDCQNRDGSLPVTAPTFTPVRDTMAPGFMGVSWDAALTVIPYNMYKQSGNTQIIEENIEAIDKYLEYLHTNKLSEEYPNLTSKTGILADWLSVDSTSADLINNAVYVYLMGLARDMAGIIGKTDLQTKYAERYNLGKEQWNAKYINPEDGKPYPITASGWGGVTTTVNDTEAAYATPLRYGIFNEDNEPKAVKNYVEAVKKAGYTITSGFSGTPNLVPVLTKYGYIDEAYRLFEQTEYASWLYPVTQGATSVWERWNSYTVEGGFNGNNSMNSFNHFSLGAISEWMMSYQLGITTEDGKAGYQNFVLQPTVGGTFTYANGSYASNYGTIYSGWTAADGEITSYQATVPANTKATLYLPMNETQVDCLSIPQGVSYMGREERNGQDCAKFTLVSGAYTFDIATKLEASNLSSQKLKAELEAARKELAEAKKAAEEAKKLAGENSAKAQEALEAAKEAQLRVDRLEFSAKKTAIKAVKSKKKKAAVVTWKKVSGAEGYLIQYSRKSNLTGGKKLTIKKGSTVSKTIKKLKSGKTYYFRLRAYKTIGGKKVYTSYSSKKSVRIK